MSGGDRRQRGVVTDAGFAGIENELFYADKTQMLFGNAKDTLVKLVAEVKQV